MVSGLVDQITKVLQAYAKQEQESLPGYGDDPDAFDVWQQVRDDAARVAGAVAKLFTEEYAVRWTEIDANGKPCYDDFSEWSCGCLKTWKRPDDAAAHAKQLRDDQMDYTSDIVVVRREVSGWAAVEAADV